MSTSGFYAWLKREASDRHHEDQELKKLISEIYWSSEGRYGSPRVHQALKKRSVNISKKRVERLMREEGLRGRVVQVTRRQPGRRKFNSQGANLLLHMAAPETMNQIWVGDVTYLRLSGKWYYLATVMDLYSRRIIGWSLATHRTAALTRSAFTYALKKRGYPKGVTFHTDKGIEYMSLEFQTLLRQHKIAHSVNRPGHCTDNAYMESFYHSLKAELIRGSIFTSAEELRSALGKYIHRFYNSVRLHSGIGYCSPIEYEGIRA